MYAAVPRITPAWVIAGAVMVGDLDASGAPPTGSMRFRQAKVEHLHRAVRAHLDVRRLQIAMDDSLLVRGFQRLRNLLRNGQRLIERNGSAREAL